uniref:Putative serine hydrolase n=2 Tax=Lygus hesperus TaxID=30085 RepID=A0A0A9VYU9_LYGHE
MLRSISTRCLRFRGLHTTNALRIDPKTVEEVRIPVPWGHIAGKWWGSREGTPVILAIHGWQDNAGSWDPVCERIPDEYSVLAVDLPGNGLSSHFPPFVSYTFLETPAILKRIVNYLNRGKIHLLGHSGGSAVCFMYACTFPEDVISYCGIDYLVYCYQKESARVTALSKNLDTAINLALRDPRKAKRYSWEEARDKWVAATKGSLTPLTAEILMQRGVSKLPDGRVVFSRDNRVKSADLNQLKVDQVTDMVRNYEASTCLLRAKDSMYFYSRGIKNFPGILDILKNQCRHYEYHDLEGNHHIHMDKADEVSEIYVSFLNQVKRLN